MTVAERVANGAALLDEKAPGWREKIDLDRLDVASRQNCVLGQVYGHYFTGREVLGLSDGTNGECGVPGGLSARNLGFNMNHEELTAEWRRFLLDLPSIVEEQGLVPA